jgi:hypothetical protein
VTYLSPDARSIAQLVMATDEDVPRHVQVYFYRAD